jgi:hypothetical protein
MRTRTLFLLLTSAACAPGTDTGEPEGNERFRLDGGRVLGEVGAHGLVARRGGETLALRTRAIDGRRIDGATPEPGGCAPSVPDGCAPSVALDHGDVVEWFAATDAGLQHGWTVHAASDELALSVEVRAGRVTAIDRDGRGAALEGADGARWRYDGLAAWDARGTPLPAAMRAEGDGLVVTVDPTIGDVQDRFTASDTTGNYFGVDGAIVGDVDADGYDDVVVGAHLDDGRATNAGALYLYYGSSSGVDTSTETKIVGPGSSAYLGWSVSGAGDIDGDGYDDIVGSGAGGAAYVHFSEDGSFSGANIDSVSPCGVYAASAAGDLNDDGFGDLVVGCYTYQPSGYYERGAAYVYLGTASGLSASGTDLSPTSGLSSYDHFGGAVSKAGDTNGDGYDDLIVGAYAYTSTFTSSAGKAYVFYGNSSGASASSYTRLTASDGATGDEFGYDVSGGGDVDGDGYDDVIVSAVLDAVGSSSSQGSAYVFYGSSSGISNASQDKITTSDGAAGDFCGYRVAMGDLDADGFADVALSCVSDDDAGSSSGSVYAYFGSSSGVSLSSQDKLRASDVGASDYFGEGGLSAFGDVDGDGAADLLVSGYRYAAAALFYGVGEDDDGDGWFEIDDCDDASSTTYPGAAERESATACMSDVDGDGYGDASPASGVTAGTDCDDGASTTYPGAAEVVADQVDQTCDGRETCYIDADGDGTTSRSGTVTSSDSDCADAGEASASATTGECDDGDASTFPGAARSESATACMTDVDGDDYGDSAPAPGVVAGTDCNDASTAFSPAATEGVGDGIDQNCDSRERCYSDADGDGYTDGSAVTSTDLDCSDAGEGSASMTTGDCDDSSASTRPGAAPNDSATACMADADGDDYGDSTPAAGVSVGTDCDDATRSVSPAATEATGDGVDQDCDGDEICYTDADRDRYTPGTTTVSSDADCTDAGELGSSGATGDCDDSDARTFPGAAPNDSVSACMTDADGDDYGDDSPASGVSVGSDCRDSSAGVNPGASETVGNNADDDCDGTETCYADADGDRYTDGATTVSSTDEDCDDAGEASAVVPTGDCDDGDRTIHTRATEVVGDEIDQDCDGLERCFADADADGYTDGANLSSSDTDCRDAGEALATAATGDCDDADATRNPGAAEGVGDEVDQDCDDRETCLTDTDEDGFTDGVTPTASRDTDCRDAGEGLASDPAGDCDDADAAIRPDAIERPGDAVDQDCDGAEDCYADADGDGFTDRVTLLSSTDTDCTDAGEAGASMTGGECDDADATVNPAAEERPGDEIDQDCDGGELCYADADGDGWTDGETLLASTDVDCADTGEASSSLPAGDCDESDAAVNPAADDVWYDGIDADCDDADDFDADGDGHASDAYGGDDCDDADVARSPEAVEVPGDERDQDCDGTELCYRDGDLDHYPDTETVVSDDADCSDIGETTDALETDCDDDAEGVHPGATDIPDDGIDQNCDGADAGSGGGGGGGGGETTDDDDEATPDEEGEGCAGCASTPSSAGTAVLLGLAALTLRRRRADGRPASR